MTRKDAMAELIAMVEAGEWPADFLAIDNGIHGVTTATMYSAFSGSLDAAKALHEAVLPDEGWHVEWVAKYPRLAFTPAAWCASVGWGTRYAAYAANPARAWLLAILRALHAMEGGE
jgi:hypothetical protein